MKFTLKNGEDVEIRELQKTHLTARDFRNYIAAILRETPAPFLLRDISSIPNLKEEAKWLKDKKKRIAKKDDAILLGLANERLIALCGGRREPFINRDKVCIGISVAKKYRGLGLGKKLLVEMIKLVKRKLKPKIIFLSVIATNQNAHKLYEKVGFRKIATFPKWHNRRGKWHDEIYLVLR